MKRCISISEIAKLVSKDYIGENININGLNLCDRTSIYDSIISYVTNKSYFKVIEQNKSIKALILDQDLYNYYKNIDRTLSFIICEDPEKIFYEIHHKLCNNTDFYDKFEFIPIIGNGCDIHSTVIIENGAIIGNNVRIGPYSIIKKGSRIGNNVVIGSNSVIGSEGFQAIKINGVPTLIIHVGGTLIKDNVHIGDNTTISNNLFEGYTTICENTIIDNLVYIAHNCFIGKNVTICAGVKLCGSCVIEDNAWIGINTSVLNKVTIGKNSKVGMGSVVTRDIYENTLAYGVPARMKKQD